MSLFLKCTHTSGTNNVKLEWHTFCSINGRRTSLDKGSELRGQTVVSIIFNCGRMLVAAAAAAT